VLLVRYQNAPGADAQWGVLYNDVVVALAGPAQTSPLRLTLADLRAALAGADPRSSEGVALEAVTLLAPIDGRTELWAAGVTYEMSRQARAEESATSASVYELVYDAERPELFMKAVAWRVVGPGGAGRVRADSEVDVPEPELAVVVNAGGEIVGYCVCDDLSSRTIEGANPLYLPQAKIYDGAAVLGPGIRPAWEVPDPYQLEVHLRIDREGMTVWSGSSSTSLLHRRLDELVNWLWREQSFPDGAILSTGTSLVPPFPFTLADGDTVDIEITGVGRLHHRIRRG
jgi:2-dehydro-3-deoxy-D-arabinonate dehydratase